MDVHLAQGVLVYAGLYINLLLIIVSFLTGKFIYLFFIILTIALIVYMNYLIIEKNSHIKYIGEWVEQLFKKYISNI